MQNAFTDKAISAADQLVAARRTGTAIHELTPQSRPSSIAEAYNVQCQVASMMNERIAGWKVGFQDQVAVRGAILATNMLQDGDTLPSEWPFVLGFEGELAFRFERDLPQRDVDYSRSEIMDAVSIMPAIEIVGTRFVDSGKVGPFDRLADNNLNAGFVAGPAIRNWSRIDLMDMPVTFAVDGEVILKKTGGHPAVDPFLPALAQANILRMTSGVRAGQIMTTGAPTGCIPVLIGKTVEISFPPVGSVTLRLAVL